MDFGLALSVFGFIFVAELPDKTALASLVLATRYKPLIVFSGAAVAFVIQTLVAILAGSLFAYLPEAVVHRVAGVLFLIFAFFMWRRKDEDDKELQEDTNAAVSHPPTKEPFYKGAWTAFLVVFLAEWGDLTQLATATLAAKYRDPLTVGVAATLALWSVTALAIVIGNRAGALFNPRLTQRVAAVIFVVLGLALLFGII